MLHPDWGFSLRLGKKVKSCSNTDHHWRLDAVPMLCHPQLLLRRPKSDPYYIRLSIVYPLDDGVIFVPAETPEWRRESARHL